MGLRTRRVFGSTAAAVAGTAPGAVYYATELVGPGGGLFLAGAGAFVGLALTLPGVSARRVIRTAAEFAPVLWPVAALVGPPADELFGPAPAPAPPDPPGLDPRWRTADVIGVARAIAADEAWGRLPVLGDALMDAGCDDEAVLAHCRGAGPDAHGSWVIDLLLGEASPPDPTLQPTGPAQAGRAV